MGRFTNDEALCWRRVPLRYAVHTWIHAHTCSTHMNTCTHRAHAHMNTCTHRYTNTLQHWQIHWNCVGVVFAALQHTATHCNTLTICLSMCVHVSLKRCTRMKCAHTSSLIRTSDVMLLILPYNISPTSSLTNKVPECDAQTKCPERWVQKSI